MFATVVEWLRVAALVLAGLGWARILLAGVRLAVAGALVGCAWWWGRESRNRGIRLLLVPARMLRVMAAKVYAPRKRGTTPKPHEFGMIFIRDGVEETHEFTAWPGMGWQDVRGLVPLLGGKRDDEVLTQAAVRVIDRLIRRSLDNRDGTPEKWEPVPIPAPGAPPGDDDDDPPKTHFTAPNGDHVPLELVEGYLAFDAGSSRRRWVKLLDEDDDITVDPNQIIDLMADLLQAASDNRPTTRSAP